MHDFTTPPPHGLIQTSGYGDSLTSLYNPITGWPLNYPEAPASILLQDDLTYKNESVVEIENYIKHYGTKINQITFYTWHKQLNTIYPELNLIYYPLFHFRHWEDAIKNQVKDKFNFTTQKEFVFLCLNMTKRMHRDRTVKLLQSFPNRLISYKSVGWNLHNHEQDWNQLDYSNYHLIYDGDKMLRNTANLIQLQPVYQKCQFSVVTETRYDLPYDFITEKTTQCWLALHPALYVSNKGHVQMLRDWGFDVFDDIFDHGYDLCENDIRLNTLVESNRKVLTHGIKEFNSLKDRLIKNRDHYIKNFMLV